MVTKITYKQETLLFYTVCIAFSSTAVIKCMNLSDITSAQTQINLKSTNLKETSFAW